MTDFIRTMWQTSAAPSGAVQVKTELQPVEQIRLPPQTAPATSSTTSAAAAARPSGLVLEKQRLVKLEVAAGPTSGFTSESAASSSSASSSPSGSSTTAVSPEAGKAQRAARRDAVNARRDKRKTETLAVVDMTLEGSAPKKLKTGKTTTGEAPRVEMMETKEEAAMALTPEMDPSGEERLRAMEAQLEHLDPDSKEAKKKRRLIRNRMSAQLHRERKKAYVGQLEEQLQSKERELKLMQDKLAAMALESAQLKQKLSSSSQNDESMESDADEVVAKKAEDEVVIKKEPLLLEQAANLSELAGLSFDAVAMEPIFPIENAATPTAAVDSTLSENWAACLESLDDAEMGSVATEDLLAGLDDYPFAGCDVNTSDPAEAALAKEVALQQQQQEAPTHHEMHAAKKNLAMMMAMMFSVTFCGQSPSVGNVASGSSFSSMFNAVPVKELSQMNIASRIMASLEKTTWKDFEDVSSWTSAAAKASAAAAAAAVAVTTEKEKTKQSEEADKAASSPSAASDTTDSSGSCDSPKQLADCLGLGFDTDVIEEFVYPVDAPFAPAMADTNWFGSESDEFGHSDMDENDEEDRKQSGNSVATSVKPVSMTSRLYEKLTALWHEKNQVLLTVLDGQNEVTRRSVADMSTIRKGMASGALFPTSAASVTATANDEVLAKNDQSVTFLYPLSAFSADQRAAALSSSSSSSSSDAMFLEVSCQLNGASTPVL